MSFISFQYLLFFPVVMLLYYLLPKKVKFGWLTIASYVCLMWGDPKYGIWVLAATVISYFAAILMEKNPQQKKLYGILSGVLCLGMLLYFKYWNFGIRQINSGLIILGKDIVIPEKNIFQPLGISFYALQVTGYIIDVYREKISAEHNFLKYALFVSFFPKFSSGPIERAGHFLTQLNEPKQPSYDDFRNGFLMTLWGFFVKLMIADRISMFVNTVYADCNKYPGYYLLVGAILYSIQIYADFSGYSSIAIGCARMLGFNLCDNFIAPYITTSPAQFWRKWHISLTSWFRDYLYIPLGGNRKGKLRKIINQMIVFLVSGLWHGADFSFIIWGGLNGAFLVAEDITRSFRTKLVSFLHLHRESIAHKILCGVFSFLLITVAWIFFRADDYHHALLIIKRMLLFNNPWIFFDGSLYRCGLDQKDFSILIASLLIMLFTDYFNSKGIILREVILKQDYWCRCLIIVFTVLVIAVFGIWGLEYDAASFIYVNF